MHSLHSIPRELNTLDWIIGKIPELLQLPLYREHPEDTVENAWENFSICLYPSPFVPGYIDIGLMDGYDYEERLSVRARGSSQALALLKEKIEEILSRGYWYASFLS